MITKFILVLMSLLPILAFGSESPSIMPHKYHPIYGKWTWTRQVNNCTEVYEFRTDNTSVVTSGLEIGESSFAISDEPDQNGFYKMTDIVTKDNGKEDCGGSPTGTPVGDKATNYILFNPSGDQMIMCEKPSLNACFGPLRRIK